MKNLAASFVSLALALATAQVRAAYVDPSALDACGGYSATNVRTGHGGLTADLVLRDPGCGIFGDDVERLKLEVTYETSNRLHVKIKDASEERYEVPESVFPRPRASSVPERNSNIQFTYKASPFSFSVIRRSTKEVLFSTENHPLIFEDQYLRVKTRLPANPNIYGLGEHTNPFRLDPRNTTLTLWSRDSYGIPVGTNLYGNHPVYFEHRTSGSHGVLLLNSNGMDVKLTETPDAGASLEYNVIGGVLDFYFFAGSERNPVDLAKQYAELVGLPAEMPYWGFGFHQCRFGYKDYVDVAGVISRYAAEKIPLETMWTDIDYMDRRRIFTVDPDYFPLNRVREIVKYLHDHDQKYILMTDPAVGYVPEGGYEAYDRGKELDIWLKDANGTDYLGVVWPGVTVYPDWFHPNAQQYWNEEFARFYSPENGIDIDGAWIDMNEPANFCDLPCTNPAQQAIDQQMPPPRLHSPPDPNTPIFTSDSAELAKRYVDIDNPPYAINNAAPSGSLSSKTAPVSIKHHNGLIEYDTHNLYGAMMSSFTRTAMLNRRPGRRPLIITRSTFAGAGREVGKWLGDNVSNWEQYRFSIAGMLAFASVYQVPMVGSDICGFAGNTTETLCARWATLGAFQPFMRNHNGDTSISQEFYIWPTVAQAARNGIEIRYRLLDYFYTAFHQAHTDGTPVLLPVFYNYPKDPATFALEHQFFFGPSVLISPVTEEDATSVDIYLPDDVFYAWPSFTPVQGKAGRVRLDNVPLTEIPVHVKGGVVLPLRVRSAMTTKELRATPFELVVAPGRDGKASGSLYVDDGESIEPTNVGELAFTFERGLLQVRPASARAGREVDIGAGIERVRILGVQRKPSSLLGVVVDGRRVEEGENGWRWDRETQVLDVRVDVGSRIARGGFTVMVL